MSATVYLKDSSPVGRLVGGDCWNPDTTDFEGKPLTIKSGVNIGQSTVKYQLHLAIPKTDPAWPAFHAEFLAAARQMRPDQFGPDGNLITPAGFSGKFRDGDETALNKKGKRPCDTEGYPGHMIYYYSSMFAPKRYVRDGDKWVETLDPTSIKRGFYVMISGSIKSNESDANPGILLNHHAIAFVSYAAEIISGPDADTMFGAATPAVPVGGSATPVAVTPPAGFAAQPGVVQPVAAVVAPAVVQPVVTPAVVQPVVTPAVVTPNPAFLQPPAGTQVAPPAAQPVAELGYIHNGMSHALEVLQANRWTPEQIAALPRG